VACGKPSGIRVQRLWQAQGAPRYWIIPLRLIQGHCCLPNANRTDVLRQGLEYVFLVLGDQQTGSHLTHLLGRLRLTDELAGVLPTSSFADRQACPVQHGTDFLSDESERPGVQLRSAPLA